RMADEQFLDLTCQEGRPVEQLVAAEGARTEPGQAVFAKICSHLGEQFLPLLLDVGRQIGIARHDHPPERSVSGATGRAQRPGTFPAPYPVLAEPAKPVCPTRTRASRPATLRSPLPRFPGHRAHRPAQPGPATRTARSTPAPVTFSHPPPS